MNFSFEINPYVFDTLYAFPYYFEGVTDTVYELYLPQASNMTVYAYGNESLQNLTAYGYTLKAVAFYLPKTNFTGSEIPFRLMNRMSPTIDNLFVYSATEIYSASNWNYKEERIFWAYKNSDNCLNLALNCIFGEWTEWSNNCSASCNVGNQTRNRTILARAFDRDCTNETEGILPCNVDQCQTTVQKVSTSVGVQEVSTSLTIKVTRV